MLLLPLLLLLGCGQKANTPDTSASIQPANRVVAGTPSPPAADILAVSSTEGEQEEEDNFVPPDPAGPDYLDLLTPDQPPETRVPSGDEMRLLFDLVGFPEVPDYDPSDYLDQVKFVWRQQSGPPIAIRDADSAQASIVLPVVDTLTTAVFEFEISNASGKRQSSVTLEIMPPKK